MALTHVFKVKEFKVKEFGTHNRKGKLSSHFEYCLESIYLRLKSEMESSDIEPSDNAEASKQVNFL